MAVPDFQTVMRPLLVVLDDGEAHTLQHLREAVADMLGVSDEEQEQLLPSGKQTTYSNRIAWALTHMGKAGLVSRPARAQYRLTDRGRKVLAEQPDRVDMTVLAKFSDYQVFRTPKPKSAASAGSLIEVADELSPSESIGRLVEGADDALADELLDRILAQPPAFLERLALRLLRAMGYGGRESPMEHTGKSGDAGIDGIVRQDALGLDLVGVQAKRYDRDSTVHRPQMQEFVGALQGAQTNRGVFVNVDGHAVVMVASPAVGGVEGPSSGDHGTRGHELVDDLAVDAFRPPNGFLRVVPAAAGSQPASHHSGHRTGRVSLARDLQRRALLSLLGIMRPSVGGGAWGGGRRERAWPGRRRRGVSGTPTQAGA